MLGKVQTLQIYSQCFQELDASKKKLHWNAGLWKIGYAELFTVTIYGLLFEYDNEKYMSGHVQCVNVFVLMSGFSLSNYSIGYSLDLNNVTERELVYLYDYTGISNYILSPSCNRSDSKFLPTVNGWKNGTHKHSYFRNAVYMYLFHKTNEHY